MALGVGALRGAHDDTGLVAVQQLGLVGTLQGDAPASGEPERQRRQHEDRDPHEVRDVVQVQVEQHRQDVVATRGPQQAVERHHRGQERRAVRSVARPLEEVVLALVAGDPGLDERVEQDAGEDQHRGDLPRDDDAPGGRHTEDAGLPAGEDPEQAFGHPHVPVRLRAGGDLGGVVGTEAPHRVDRHQPAHEGRDAEHHEEVPSGLRGVDRHHRVADDVLVGAARAGPLGVLLVDEQHHVRPDEREQQPGDEQHVGDVEPGDDQVAGELAAEEEERHVGAHHRGGLDQPVGDAEPGARQQVVGQRVAGEPLQDAQQQQHAADQPVDLARLAEGSGDEHADEVDEHRRDEQHRCPVVHLPHQQTGTHVEGDVQRGRVGLGHVQAAEGVVGAVVDDLGHARLVPEAEEHSGDQEYDEAPQRDLAQHERPVVGEDLADLLLRQPRHPGALVGVVGSRADLRRLRRLDGGLGVGAHVPSRSQKLGPTGSVKSRVAMR